MGLTDVAAVEIEEERRTAANNVIKFASSVQRHELICKALLGRISADYTGQIDSVHVDAGLKLSDAVPGKGSTLKSLFEVTQTSFTCRLSVQKMKAMEDGDAPSTTEEQKETTTKMRRAPCRVKELEHAVTQDISDIKERDRCHSRQGARACRR
eukprot:9263939-Pyramimonas_sp.AAC.1